MYLSVGAGPFLEIMRGVRACESEREGVRVGVRESLYERV